MVKKNNLKLINALRDRALPPERDAPFLVNVVVPVMLTFDSFAYIAPGIGHATNLVTVHA